MILRNLKKIFIPIIFAGTLIITFLSLPKYAKTALLYGLPGIYDYRIFVNDTINCGPAPYSWPIGSFYNKYLLSHEDIACLKEFKTSAFLIIRNRKIVFEYYSNEGDTLQLSNSFSMAKSIVGFAVLKALDLGYIHSLQDYAVDYLPFIDMAENKFLTIENLLTMSSGLNWDESYNGLFNSTTEAYYGDNLLKLMRKMKVTEPPGKQFKYLSGNTLLLAGIVTNASGMTLSEFVEENIWRKIGSENPALWSLDREFGFEKAYCCFNSTARDFARFGELILEEGCFMGDTIINPEVYRLALQAASYLRDEHNDPVDFYGYHLGMLKHKGKEVKYMRGILGQYVFAIPEENTVIVRLGHERSKTYQNHHPSDVFKYLDLSEKITCQQ